ncbi:uncharacterized protein LOC101848640 [Aplysia californica]|uniref:Uncharacterized protein LOC101848640 n=1 Tax=Aplysia californica TaxID=6500 RepID=A0ABM0KB63_APLCA|nr:uncharacterized protein LOC101848640 [Aplysia californica]
MSGSLCFRHRCCHSYNWALKAKQLVWCSHVNPVVWSSIPAAWSRIYFLMCSTLYDLTTAMSSEKDGHEPVELSLLDEKRGHTKASDDNKTNMGGSCSSNRIWMVIAVVFVAISIGLSAYIVYDNVSTKKLSEKEVVLKYPGYFRTPAQQAVYAAQIEQTLDNNVTIVPPANITNPDKRNCTFNCSGGRPQRKRRDAYESGLLEMVSAYQTVHALERRAASGTLIYHGCCISKHMFDDPSELLNAHFEERTIAQFQGQRQYFLYQQCRHAPGCNGCTCGQETLLVTAVVENPDTDSDVEYVLDLVRVPGCCKCYNNLN